jgi:hypothetical protein
MMYLGDFNPGEIVYIPFNTFDSNDPSASVTITNLANTDIHIHKNDGTTQRNNAAGVTVNIDFDTITGNHLLEIDTSDNTVANFFAGGADYFVRMEGTTVDAATVNAWVAHFSLWNRADTLLGTTVATYSSQTSFTLTAGSADNDAYNGHQVIIQDLTTAKQIASGVVSDYVGATKTVTLAADPGFTFAANDHVRILPQKEPLQPTTIGNTLDVTATGAAGIDWGNVENKTTANDLSGTDIQLCDTITTYTGNTVQTGDSFARLGAPAGVSVSADIATVDGNVDSILTDTGTTLENHLTDIKGTGFVKDTHSLTDILTDVTGLNGDAMRGTDSAALASVCTEARLAELDAANLPANIDSILTDTGTTLENHITDIKGTGFVKDTHSLTDILTDVTGLNGDAMRGTDSAALASVCTEARLAELDAANLPTDISSLNDLSTTDILGMAYEGAEDFQDFLRLARAVLYGKLSISGNDVTFRNAADTGNRVVSTTDSTGQRTAVTTDAT